MDKLINIEYLEAYAVDIFGAKFIPYAALKDIDAVDAVPVVRCKNCRHFGCNLENDTFCRCCGGLSDTEEDDFCSYGERKDNERT